MVQVREVVKVTYLLGCQASAQRIRTPWNYFLPIREYPLWEGLSDLWHFQL